MLSHTGEFIWETKKYKIRYRYDEILPVCPDSTVKIILIESWREPQQTFPTTTLESSLHGIHVWWYLSQGKPAPSLTSTWVSIIIITRIFFFSRNKDYRINLTFRKQKTQPKLVYVEGGVLEKISEKHLEKNPQLTEREKKNLCYRITWKRIKIFKILKNQIHYKVGYKFHY